MEKKRRKSATPAVTSPTHALTPPLGAPGDDDGGRGGVRPDGTGSGLHVSRGPPLLQRELDHDGEPALRSGVSLSPPSLSSPLSLSADPRARSLALSRTRTRARRVVLTFGIERTFRICTAKGNRRGTIAFFAGLFLVRTVSSFVGFLLQCYAMFLLFTGNYEGFLSTLIRLVKMLPVIGPVSPISLARALHPAPLVPRPPAIVLTLASALPPSDLRHGGRHSLGEAAARKGRSEINLDRERQRDKSEGGPRQRE